MIKSLVAAIDGSAYSGSVMQLAIELALWCDAKLKVLNVIDARTARSLVFVNYRQDLTHSLHAPVVVQELESTIDAAQAEKSEKVLKVAEEMCESRHVKHELSYQKGVPADVISDRSRSVDLVLLGYRGESSELGQYRVGSTAETVARYCQRAVLLVPQDFRAIGSILVPFDGSNFAGHALQYAGHLASLRNLPVIVLTVHPEPDRTQQALSVAKEYLEAYGVQTKLVGRKANVADEILRLADEEEAGLIVMGAFGQSKIRETILGSKTEQVIRRAGKPLMLVK